MSGKRLLPKGPWRIEPEVLRTELNDFFGRPELTPGLPGWEANMPRRNEKQSAPPRLPFVNEINDTWMEFPRFENIAWGLGWIGSGITLVPLLFIMVVILNSLDDGAETIILLGLGFLFILSLFFLNVKLLLISPRGSPIRFNRKRQKIYVYEFQRKWNPWAHWPTVIKVYDWKDIRAEMTYETGRYNQGYRLYGAVCLPGTDQVLERFVLSWSVGHPKLLYGLWSHCCLYMRHEKVPERPLFTERPREWCLWDNVHWPADIDRESTTAAEPQITNIKTEGPNPCL